MNHKIQILRQALDNIAEGEIPRPVKHVFRKDGTNSKYDTCMHDLAMWQDCHECVVNYIRDVLKETN
jgi:hypothetical protein